MEPIQQLMHMRSWEPCRGRLIGLIQVENKSWSWYTGKDQASVLFVFVSILDGHDDGHDDDDDDDDGDADADDDDDDDDDDDHDDDDDGDDYHCDYDTYDVEILVSRTRPQHL